MTFATPAQQRRARKQLEGHENTHRDALKRFAWNAGYLAYNTHRSDKSPPGYPDLIVLSPPDWPGLPTLIVAELKRPGNRPTEPQRSWLNAFAHLGTLINRAVGFELVLVTLLIVPDGNQAFCDLLLARKRERLP